jgi:EAL domain-containing protein (putative c-di-GMP-specific phosphodiesterase class I)
VTLRTKPDRFEAVTPPALRVVPTAPASARQRTDLPSEGGASPVPFDVFAEHTVPRMTRRFGLAEAREMLDEGRFWTEYQAIIQARTGKTVAYEALARFERRDGRPVAPTKVFGVLHADPSLLLRAELTLKLHQVEHAPRPPLFVNLDPDSWARAGDRTRNPFLALFASSGRRIVVEVTEAMAIADLTRAREMISALRARRLPVALDDVGAANGILSFDAITDAEVLKFDRSLIPRMRAPRCRALVQALTRMARETGAHSILEGVETTADFVLARDIGFDFVQGFLFKDRSQLARR